MPWVKFSAAFKFVILSWYFFFFFANTNKIKIKIKNKINKKTFNYFAQQF